MMRDDPSCAEVCSSGMKPVGDQRRLVRRLFDAGVAAADPSAAVARHLGQCPPPARIIAVGKAGRKMAQAALDRWLGVPCLVVTNYENAQALAGARVMAAGHPVPDTAGVRGAEAALEAAATAGGPVLVLVSGGGSALLPAPAGAITLDDKVRLNRLLLQSGLDIKRMNLIRQQVSRIKGGRLARAAAPQQVTALILSDVVDDDLSAIASGPTVAPLGTRQEAAAILREAGLWDALPPAMATHLQDEHRAATVLPAVNNILIGSNRQSVAAMAQQAPQATVLCAAVEGDVNDAALRICDAARVGITLWGGETTVRLRGTGRGGRNQELALRIAQEADRRGWRNWTCLQAGTDGRDGPTDAAGGLVDAGTLTRIARAGGDVDALLANNDSYRALQMANDLLVTGPTGTNVADLGVLIRVQ